MNLKNRALRLFAVISIISSLFTSPAAANDITFDSSGLKVPAGITFTVDGITSQYGASYLLVSVSSTINTDSKILTFKDFAISGIPIGTNPGAQKIQYFYGDSLNQQTYLYLLEGDITAQKLNLVITGNGTLENKSDISYPRSYNSVISSLDAMGLEVTEGFNSVNADAQYSYYVLAKLKPGIAPFRIKVESASISANGLLATPLRGFWGPILMGTDPVDINLGYSSVDASINLTRVAIKAEFSVYSPSSVTSTILLPTGIAHEPIAHGNIYYDDVRKKSEINFYLKNTSEKTISIDVGKIQAIDTSNGGNKVVATLDKDYGLVSIKPSTSPDDYAYLSLTGDGDLTQNAQLNIAGSADIAIPSKFDVSKVKLPRGYQILPIDFSNLGYDPKKKATFLYLSISKPGTSASAAALSFLNMKLESGKISTTYLYAGPYTSNDKTLQYYSHEIGSINGDVRSGKKFTLSGNVVALARTKYTNTATFLKNDEEALAQSYPSTPEYWKYDSKTKTTSITQSFYLNNQPSVVTIYSCNLYISHNSKAIKPITSGTKIDSETSDGEVVIAIVPGDLRVKGGNVQISGSYSLQPCK